MDQVSKIREKIDLISLISEYIPLKKMGRNFKTNCPFHNEKTPSFIVSPERQIWHCFGCSKGGDCYTFLMEYENLEFPEALRILAKKAGVELLESSSWESGISSKKEKIYKLNSLALGFYHYLLTKHNIGKKALLYLLQKRKIKEGVLNTFMIGFAPGLNNALSNYLIDKKKYKKEDLIEAGLATQRGGDIVDFFTNRIIFPLADHRGNIIGFSGRVLEDQQILGSKYVNTRETIVYHKGDVFFGLNIAKDEIKKDNQAIMTEGEFDVISAFQEGVKNIIAVKGTALTENQVNLLSRFTQKVSLCFDMDKAGQDAIKRSLPILEKKGLTTTVILLAGGKDPDESIKSDPLTFKKAIKNDIGIYDYLISKFFSEFDKKTIDGKRKISDELLPILQGIENEIVKEHYFKKLALELDTSYESIIKQAERLVKRDAGSFKTTGSKDKRSREEVLEEYLLALILQANDFVSVFKKAKDILENSLPKNSSYQKILDMLFSFENENKTPFDDKKFINSLPSELLDAYNTSYLNPLPKFEEEKTYLEEVEKVASELKVVYLRSRIKAVSEKIKNKEKEGKKEELEVFEKELSSLLQYLQKTQISPS